MSQPVSEDRLWSLVTIDQQRITALDTVMAAIKGWVVTLGSAPVGIAISSDRRGLVVVAIVATMFFATLDFRYRTVQLAHAARSTAVELSILPGFEFPRYQSRRAAGFVGRINQASYMTTSMFYLIVLLVLLLVWLFN